MSPLLLILILILLFGGGGGYYAYGPYGGIGIGGIVIIISARLGAHWAFVSRSPRLSLRWAGFRVSSSL